MRLPSTCFWTCLFISVLTAVDADAQTSLKDSVNSDPAYVAALNQYHIYVAPEVGLYRGMQYVDYDYTVQKGQPFFGPNEIRGGTVWYNGIRYDHVRMLYDLVKDQLVINDPYKVYKISLFMEMVDSFMLDDHRLIKLRDTVAASWLRNGYFEELYRGRILLLKREQKSLHENLVISSDNIRLFIDSSTSYYFKNPGGYHPVKTKREVLNLFNNRRSEVRKVIRKSRLHWHDDKEQILLMVAAWYDGANH
jgi:hypothetical protein